MDNKDNKKNCKKEENSINSKVKLDILKSNYILKKIFFSLSKKNYLEIIKYNKKMQTRINLTIDDYKDFTEKFSSIEIEIKPIKVDYNKFINIINKKDEKYYHIYFNDSKEEIKRYNLNEDDKVNSIKIIIDYQIKSFYKLFFNCECIKSINFIKFYRIDITNMSYMFFGCSSLKEINFTYFNTDNVTNMSGMFSGCSSLEELNLSNFNTNNVTDMNDMFANCSSLTELNIANFNTSKVKDMSCMFCLCSSLEVLNLSNFNTNKVINMNGMFLGCSLLREIIISNFNIDNVKGMIWMFDGCSEDLKAKFFKHIKK